MIAEITKLLIKQYEYEKETGEVEYIKISKVNFYKGLIKFLKMIER